MVLSKIKKANKRWKHEQARKEKRRKDKLLFENRKKNFKNKQANRRQEIDYVNELKGEL